MQFLHLNIHLTDSQEGKKRMEKTKRKKLCVDTILVFFVRKKNSALHSKHCTVKHTRKNTTLDITQ